MNNDQGWFGRRKRAGAARHGSGGPKRGRGGPRRGAVLEVLALEDRQLLSTIFMVTSKADSGPGTLRAAVDLANKATTPAEIDFSLGKKAATITLTSGQ